MGDVLCCAVLRQPSCVLYGDVLVLHPRPHAGHSRGTWHAGTERHTGTRRDSPALGRHARHGVHWPGRIGLRASTGDRNRNIAANDPRTFDRMSMDPRPNVNDEGDDEVPSKRREETCSAISLARASVEPNGRPPSLSHFLYSSSPEFTPAQWHCNTLLGRVQRQMMSYGK